MKVSLPMTAGKASGDAPHPIHSWRCLRTRDDRRLGSIPGPRSNVALSVREVNFPAVKPLVWEGNVG